MSAVIFINEDRQLNAQTHGIDSAYQDSRTVAARQLANVPV